MKIIVLFVLGIVVFTHEVTAQDSAMDGKAKKKFVVRTVCKGYRVIYDWPLEAAETRLAGNPSPVYAYPEQKHTTLLKVSGNLLYDVSYRSRIDTPYAENNIYQHTLQTRLDFVYKDQYPFKLYLTTRFSNSSLFRNYTDLNWQYNQSDFTRLLKKRIADAAEYYRALAAHQTDSLLRIIENKKAALAALRQSTHTPDGLQVSVEKRERMLFGSPEITASNTEDKMSNWEKSLLSRRWFKFGDESTRHKEDTNRIVNDFHYYKDNAEKIHRKVDTLLADLEKLEGLYRSARSLEETKVTQWKKDIEEAKDANTLAQKVKELDLPDSLLPKGFKSLYAIQSLSIGRSTANYSELSVKNTSITGVQVEYNPGYYYALAVGKVDYRFRDYIIPSGSRSNQYVALARFGKGMKNGNHVILTYYTGKRQLFNSAISTTTDEPIPAYNLAGITIEALYRIHRYTSIIAEVAKSTLPYYSVDSLQQKDWMNSVSRFSDRTNEAYALRINSYLPKTKTRLTGNVKYLGANFQSFSTFTSGASQLKWLTRIEQPFFKNKLNLLSSVQQNDYNNPFASAAYKSSSILASVQATLRFRKWPILSVGYYPSYQLTKINNDSYSESRYYTLIGSASYFYRLHDVQLSSYVVYSHFYNHAADSGFVYYNSKNLLVSQAATVGRFSVTLNGSASVNTDYNIYTIENSDQLTINRFVRIGAGVKMIRHTLLSDLLWGYSGNLALTVPKLGEIQLVADKGFIPGLNKQLVQNNMGRLTYSKTF